jgi:photosystem II stability/assembly factor-like uncharacterized protein
MTLTLKLWRQLCIPLLLGHVASFRPFRVKSNSAGLVLQAHHDAVSFGTTFNNKVKTALHNVARSASALAVLSLVDTASVGSGAHAAEQKKWGKCDLPTQETLFDITFDPKNPSHGWLVGAKGTFLETADGGETWAVRTFSALDENEEITYRFQTASLLDNEGWIIGKPAIMLHTKNGGKQFERIPLSPKLPGEPCSICATGPDVAEMITTQGAVYTTSNGGLNWKAQVKETIDATLNRVSSSGTSGASFFTGTIISQVILSAQSSQ